MKKRSFVLMGFVFILFLVNFVSAGVYFSELNTKYNLGDMIDFNVKVDPVKEGLLLNVKLYCSGNFVIEFNNLPSSDGRVNIKLPLNFNTINRANGDCYFIGFYNGESWNSINFEISKLLIVKLNVDTFFAKPNEAIVIIGSAEKLNGNPVNGEIEIKIPLLETLKPVEEDSEILNNSETQEVVENSNESNENNENTKGNISYDAGIFYGRVSDGKFSVNIKIPEDAPAGDFRIDILVYEKSGEEKSSEGVAYANLKIFQIVKAIELNLNTQNFDPGTIAEIKPKLLDQTGISVNEEVSVVVRNELKERLYEKIVKSDEGINYEIPKNLLSGYYSIEASTNNMNVSKSFFVNEKAIVNFDLVNDTLIVTNVGNIPYQKNIEVELNGKPFIKFINLGLGESTSFKLTGSEGDYNVKVKDGDNEFSRSGVPLTGKVVSVNAVQEGLSLNNPIFWIFFFVILILILLFLFRSIFKRRSFAFHSFKPLGNSGSSSTNQFSRNDQISKEKSSGFKPKPVIFDNASEVRRLDFKGNTISNKADQEMVMSGDKSKVAVVVIKVKNRLARNEKKVLEQAMESVYSKKGAVYEQGDFIFAIFSPLMTKNLNNEHAAILTAQNIHRILSEYNKKFKEIINFGIAVNSGEIINKIENGKLKFTALGNIFISAKRLADISKEQVLLTRDSFQRMGSQVKADKINEGVYLLRAIIDAEKNSKFIKGFLDRQEKK